MLPEQETDKTESPQVTQQSVLMGRPAACEAMLADFRKQTKEYFEDGKSARASEIHIIPSNIFQSAGRDQVTSSASLEFEATSDRLKEFKALLDAGLVREKFIRQADEEILESLRHFQKHYDVDCVQLRIGEVFIRDAVLTPALVENTIISGNMGVIMMWAQTLAGAASPLLIKLIENDQLSAPVAMQLINSVHHSALDSNDRIETLAALITPGASNAITWGMTDIIEHEAAQAIAMEYLSRREEFVTEQHRLLRALRTTEYVTEKRQQVEVVVAADDARSFKEQLEAVWQSYAAQSPLFKEIDREMPVAEEVRAANVRSVNSHQPEEIIPSRHREYFTSKVQEPNKRFVDIYGRYNCAEMDPFMMAIMTRTVNWYVENRHAALFTDVRLVPDRFDKMEHGLDAVPWAARLLCPKMSVLKLSGGAFKTSLFGANRFFLTHSLSQDATERGSIPIIGISTWQNVHKLYENRPYALFEADFDRFDPHRSSSRSWFGDNQASSITGIIDETLRALREVEMLEISRADGAALRLSANHKRWELTEDNSAEGVRARKALMIAMTRIEALAS